MKTLLTAVCLVLIFAGCKKGTVSPPCNSQGTIIGYDLRECPSPACGGLLITIKNDTAANPPPYYHIGATLQQLGISENTKPPINVSLNYKPDTGILAQYHYIMVTQIKIVH